MSELMEHESIDDVASRAVATARRDVAVRSLPELRLRTPRPWFALTVAFAAVAVVVVGLIAIGTNRDESAGNDPASLRWLLRDLPVGWRPTTVFDSTTASPRPTMPDPFVSNLYATDAEPLGPYLSVQGTTDMTQSIEIGSYSSDVARYEEFDLDSKRAAFAELANGDRGLYVEINSAWVYLSSRGLSDDVLLGLARTLTPDAGGHYDVAGSALPDGMRKVGSANDQPRDFVSVGYSPTSGVGALEFAVGRASASLSGVGTTGYDFTAIAEDGFSGFIGSLTLEDSTPPTTAWMVLWRRDGLQFSLSGQGVSSDQIVKAAASASQASQDEWADLLGSQIEGPSDTAAPTGTAPAEAIVDIEPPFAGEPRDVAITVTVDDISDNEQRWSGKLPTGESWTAVITRVYDRMDVRYSIDGNLTERSFGASTDFVGDNQVTCCSPMAMTRNPEAASLRVLRSNGERYTIALHELPGTDGVRIALIAIPDSALLTELIDATGNIVESYTPS